MKKIRWGIVSAGRISDIFCADLAQVEDAQIHAIAARNLQDAKTFAEKHDIPHYYQGYQSLFDDPNIDVVYIGTPHTCHFDNAKAALMAGKHVLCEKPIVVSPTECEQLSALALTKKLVLMEALWTYFLPAIQCAKQWISEGRIGHIQHVKIDFGLKMDYSPDTRVYNKELAGGCLYDMGIYPLALAWYFLQKPITNLVVFNKNAPNGVDEDIVLVGDCEDIKVNLSATFRCLLANAAQIIGDKGYIEIPSAVNASTAKLYQQGKCIDSFSDGRKTYGYDYEIVEMHQLIRQGQLQSAVMPHSTSLHLQRQMAWIKDRFR